MRHVKVYEDFLNESATKYGLFGRLLFKDISAAKRYESMVKAGMLTHRRIAAEEISGEAVNEGLSFNSISRTSPADAWKSIWEEAFGPWFKSMGAKVLELNERKSDGRASRGAVIQAYRIKADGGNDSIDEAGAFFTQKEADAAKSYLEKNCIGTLEYSYSTRKEEIALKTLKFDVKELFDRIEIKDLRDFEKAGAKIDVEGYLEKVAAAENLDAPIAYEAEATTANMGSRKPTKNEEKALEGKLRGDSYFSTLNGIAGSVPLTAPQCFNYMFYEYSQEDPRLVAWSQDASYAPRGEFWIALRASSGLVVPIKCYVNTTGQKDESRANISWLELKAPAHTADRVIETYRRDTAGQAGELKTLISRWNRVLKML